MLNHANDVRVFGTQGWLEIPQPWVANRQSGGKYEIRVHKGGKTETRTVETDKTAFAHEAEAFAAQLG
jgi:predicted dehydrogenase